MHPPPTSEKSCGSEPSYGKGNPHRADRKVLNSRYLRVKRSKKHCNFDIAKSIELGTSGIFCITLCDRVHVSTALDDLKRIWILRHFKSYFRNGENYFLYGKCIYYIFSNCITTQSDPFKLGGCFFNTNFGAPLQEAAF